MKTRSKTYKRLTLACASVSLWIGDAALAIFDRKASFRELRTESKNLIKQCRGMMEGGNKNV